MKLVSRLLSLLFLSLLAFTSLAASSQTLQQQTEKLAKFNQNTNVTAVARERQNEILRLLQTSPAAVKPYLLKNAISKKLPSQVQAYIEKEVTNIEGTLEIRAAQNLNKTETIQYVLRTDNNVYYHLNFTDKVTTLKSGSRIKIKHAYQMDDVNRTHLLILSIKDVVTLREPSLTAIPSAFGPQKTMIFLVNFQNAPTVQPWTKDQMRNVFFTTVSNMYYEYSFHQTTVVGDVIGYFTVPLNSNIDCQTMTDNLPGMAETAAANAGIDVSGYNRHVYIFPTNTNCSWAGLGTIGFAGAYSKTWLNGYTAPYYSGHELGHNLGLFHSNYYRCTTSPVLGCTNIEYADNSDIMGGGYPTGHFNAFQKERLGWLNYQSQPPIPTVTTTGTYNIDVYETFNTNAKALKVLKANLPDGSKDYYYLEFRQGVGFDNFLATCTNCDFTQGVSFHIGNSNDVNSSHLIDMTYNDANERKAVLLPGQTFTDPNAANGGVSFKVNSISSTGASVSIQIGTAPPPTCTRNAATFSVNPSSPVIVTRGGTASFMLTLTNNDTAVCAANNYVIRANTTNTWLRPTLSTNTLTLNPGQTGTVNLSVLTSIATLSGTTYRVRVGANNTTVPGPQLVTTALVGVN